MSKCKLVYLKHSEIEVLLACLHSAPRAKTNRQKLIAKLTTARNTKLKKKSKTAFVPVAEYLTMNSKVTEIGVVR